ncbi:MAG TPA: tetratricopeptide repeat protein [Polyangiaceae bacterium]|jgi:tetratricopeptide (TPR) repeat protein|nr:tetratricopeptide repeat protein [Polyangiaceae bacterium]
MDQFSAHLDRGWELVQRGDTRGAAASARRALELDPSSPEAHNLLGFVAAMEGEGEEAIEAYQQAIALDETYLEAMLNAAEVYIAPLGDFDQAIRMCDQALDLAEVDEELIDALLLKFDALMGKGDRAGAEQVLGRVPPGPYENPGHLFLVGRAHYELGDVEKSRHLVEQAADKDPRHPEAHYYLGLIKDELGDARGATLAFLRARELDLAQGMPPWAPPREDWEEAAARAFQELNPLFLSYVEGADVFISDVPGVELVAEGVDPRALLLLDGFDSAVDEAAPELVGGRGSNPTRARVATRATRVFVYAINVARQAGQAGALEHEVLTALEREITATFLEPEQNERGAKEMN